MYRDDIPVTCRRCTKGVGRDKKLVLWPNNFTVQGRYVYMYIVCVSSAVTTCIWVVAIDPYTSSL